MAVILPSDSTLSAPPVLLQSLPALVTRTLLRSTVSSLEGSERTFNTLPLAHITIVTFFLFC